MKVIKLENNENYLITKEIEYNNITYVYLTNIKDVLDFCIRKTDETKENLIGLEDEKELNLALELFQKENNK